jgi:uncharacterized protein (TIGR03089 family)
MANFYTKLNAASAKRGPMPVVTWINDVGRIELSNVTFANAVSKASNFLINGLELTEESSIAVDLGNHWQSPVWLGTALATGIKVTDQDPVIRFGTLAAAQVWTGDPDEFVVVSQDPFGMPDKDVPVGFVNGSAEVRNFGDYFSPAWPQDSHEIVLATGGKEFTWDQLVAHTLELATKYGIKAEQNYGLQGLSDLLTTTSLQVVLPIINQNSVVLIDQANPDIDAIKKQEKLEQIVLLG